MTKKLLLITVVLLLVAACASQINEETCGTLEAADFGFPYWAFLVKLPSGERIEILTYSYPKNAPTKIGEQIPLMHSGFDNGNDRWNIEGRGCD